MFKCSRLMWTNKLCIIAVESGPIGEWSKMVFLSTFVLLNLLLFCCNNIFPSQETTMPCGTRSRTYEVKSYQEKWSSSSRNSGKFTNSSSFYWTSQYKHYFNFKEVGFKMMDALPRDSSIIRIRNRCAFTSRPRGIVTRWRLSRIAWRHLADYNQLSGVQRAIWWSKIKRTKSSYNTNHSLVRTFCSGRINI